MLGIGGALHLRRRDGRRQVRALAHGRGRGVPDDGVYDDGVYDYDGFDRLREDAAVDVAYVVLPNALHADWTARAT